MSNDCDGNALLTVHFGRPIDGFCQERTFQVSAIKCAGVGFWRKLTLSDRGRNGSNIQIPGCGFCRYHAKQETQSVHPGRGAS